ncbi:hypothetical protein ACWNT8_14745 [Pigmentibacter ruber]
MKYFIIVLLFILSNTAKTITYGEVLDMWVEGIPKNQRTKITYSYNMLIEGAPNPKLCSDTLNAVLQEIISQSNILSDNNHWSPEKYEIMSKKIINENLAIIKLSCWPQKK